MAKGLSLRSSTELRGQSFRMPGTLPGGSNPLQLHLKQGLHTLPFSKRERKYSIQPLLRTLPGASGITHLTQEGEGPGLTCLSRSDRTGRAEICTQSVDPGASSFLTERFCRWDPLGENRARHCSKGPDVRITK